MSQDRQAGGFAAAALVVASMIGTGVFVSLHFQVLAFDSGPLILLLWLVGGLVALCGALCYAALAKALPKSGGEYHFLSELYHPSLGFMAGLLSAVVGFAAPTAVTALALGDYLHSSLPGVRADVTAVGVILAGAAFHTISARTSGRVQVAATVLKLALISTFLIAAAILPGHGDVRWAPRQKDWAEVFQPAFASALFFVFYGYSGWNAAVYGLEEWERPEKTVKRALVGGTLLVMALYLALNAAFLHAAPLASLRGSVAVADVAAAALFGSGVAHWPSALLALGLFSSVSALLWAGPRVLGAMGRDVPALGWFASKDGVPLRSLGFQTVLALFFVLFGQIRDLVNYTQAGLTLCSGMAVAGIFLLHRRGLARELNPLLPLVFVAMAAFVVIQALVDSSSRLPTFYGLLTVLACALLWFPLNRKSP